MAGPDDGSPPPSTDARQGFDPSAPAAHDRDIIVGLDIGATKWLAVAQHGRTRTHVDSARGWISETPATTFDEVGTWLRSVTARGDASIAALGCSFAGSVDQDGLVTRWPNRPTWSGARIRDGLRALCRAPVIVEDDGVCAAYGEQRAGVAAPYKNFLCVSLGTGIGSALVLDGRLRRRPGREALPLGHWRVGGARPCGCGSRGCIQTVVSGAAFAHARSGSRPPDALPEAGVRSLSRLIADVARFLGLDAVVLTGGLLEHLAPLRDTLLTSVADALMGEACAVLMSTDPTMSAVKGALALAQPNTATIAPSATGSHAAAVAVVFDLDGTLVDSQHVMVAAFREAYAQTVGAGEPPVRSFLDLVGDSFPNILNALGLPPEMWEPFRAASRRRVGELSLFDGMLDVCRKLRRHGIPLAVLTGKDRERTVEVLERLGCADLFSVLATCSDGFDAKPSPAGIYRIAEKLRVPPRRICTVGDAAHDVVAANRAGAWAIGCAWGTAGEQTLRDAGAHLIVHDPKALMAALDEWLGTAAG